MTGIDVHVRPKSVFTMNRNQCSRCPEIRKEQMAEMQKVIDAEKSDLFDVLAHVAYALAPLTRAERAEKARTEISTRFTTKQQVFLDFVLSHYVSVGVEELAPEKLSPLLRLKYNNSIPDAVGELGEAPQIRKVFSSFQRFLYQGVAQLQSPGSSS